jgi:hypothetical protein
MDILQASSTVVEIVTARMKGLAFALYNAGLVDCGSIQHRPSQQGKDYFQRQSFPDVYYHLACNIEQQERRMHVM